MAGLPGTGASCGFSYGPCLCRRFYRGVPFTDLCSPEKMSGDHVSDPGIFPLVPGMGIYQTAQALVGSDWDLAASKGLTSIKFAVAIVGGILLGFEIPQRCFSLLESRKRRSGKFS